VGLGPARRRSRQAVEPPIRTVILAIGKQRRGPLDELEAEYLKRLKPAPAIVELEEKRKLPPAQLKAREAELILAAVPAGALLVALDERGQSWSSRELAERLAAWRDRGAATLAFAIGGADGLGTAIIERADAIVSLGAMTWPHLMVRSLLLEQLYRARQILAGHPYHRD
jgi:23S rRNA (pseudouridine1915-N3)-methyltransferase